MSSISKAKPRAESVFLLPEGQIKEERSLHVPFLIGLFLLLMVVGMFNLYSASMGEPYFMSQLLKLGPALILFVIFGWLVPVRHVNTYAYWIYGIICFLLLAVFLAGHIAGGSQRWISMAGMKLQPSELAKVASAIIVARFFFTNRLVTPYNLRDLWPLLAMLAVIFGLIFEQPDLGTAGICMLIAVAQLTFISIDKRSIMYVIASSIVVGVVGWFVFLHDYQKLRIINLFNPYHDPQGSGYHSLQSLIAVGSGGLLGKGFLQGTQTQLQFLPARHTDFAFSVFAEEHGFWGAAIVFVLFGALVYLALDIARQAKDTFSGLLAVGIAALMFVEFVINVSMVLGIFPVVGVPLPMFSHGGSALFTNSIGLGMLVAISRDNVFRDKKRR